MATNTDLTFTNANLIGNNIPMLCFFSSVNLDENHCFILTWVILWEISMTSSNILHMRTIDFPLDMKDTWKDKTNIYQEETPK